jgi:hypothetical protein
MKSKPIKLLIACISLTCVISFVSCSSETKGDDQNTSDSVNAYQGSKSEKVKLPDLNTISPGAMSAEQLYYSEADSPSREEAAIIKAKCIEGLSTYGVCKIRTALLSMTEYLVTVIENYSALGGEAYWAGQESQLPTVDRQIEVMMSNVEAMKKYVRDEDVVTDLTTVQQLLSFSKDDSDISGIFYAHHLLNDLSYWGYGFGLNEQEYSTGEMAPSTAGKDCYYGLTKVWGNSYPAYISSIIDKDVLYKIEATEFDLGGQVEKSDAVISSFNSDYSDSERQKIKSTLNKIDDILCEYIYLPGDSWEPVESRLDTKAYEDLALFMDELTAMTEDSAISPDIHSAEGFLSLYNNDDDTFSPQEDKRFILISCHRIVSELSGIVLNNDEPALYNNPYYSALKLLEPDKMSSKEYEYFSGKEEPPSDDASQMDDFFGNRVLTSL